MLCSVIIPVFNADKYLLDTLASVVNQTWKNLEVIVVNDGSTDNSQEIISSFMEEYSFVKSINQKSKGQCAASNVGLQHASGDYIKFLDADDILNERHIELQMDRLSGRNDALASCEWGRFYDGDAAKARFIPESVWKDMNSLDWIKAALKQKNDMMGGWLWLIPRSLIEKTGGWNEQLSLNNDFEFSIRLLCHSNEVLFAEGARLYYRSGLEANLANSKSESAYQAALLSTELGCKQLLAVENSKDTRQLCANRFMQWLYRIYPLYPQLQVALEDRIHEFGGSNLKMEGSKWINLLVSVVGWKMAKRIQLAIYKLGYTPRHPHK